MKNKLFVVILLIAGLANGQSPEWIIFKAPSSPIAKNLSSQNDKSIGIAKNVKSNPKLLSNENGKNNILKSNSRYSTSLPANFIVSLAQDNRGNIWAGTFSGGIAMYDGIEWLTFNTANSILPSNVIYSIAVDRKNNKWIGTIDGLVKYNGQKWTVYKKKNSRLPNNMIYSIAIDKNDDVWIGTAGGLAVLSKEKWKVYNTRNSNLPDNNITAMAIDSFGNKWIGTYNGLVKFDDNKWTVYKTANSALPYNDIYSITAGASGVVYVNTWGGGLAVINKSRWKTYDISNSKLPDNSVSSLVTDLKGNLWVGTLNGLAEFDGSDWKIFNSSNSMLPNNMVYSLLNDQSGNLWIGTEKGLAVYHSNGIGKLKADITNLNVSVEGYRVSLTWKCKTSSLFEVEVENEQSDWKTIPPEYSNNYNSVFGSYSQLIEYFGSESASFRVKQTDVDGAIKYSESVSVHFEKPYSLELINARLDSSKKEIKLNVALPESSNINVTILDAYGREAAFFKKEILSAGYHELKIENGALKNGTYLFQLRNGKSFVSKKLFLQ